MRVRLEDFTAGDAYLDLEITGLIKACNKCSMQHASGFRFWHGLVLLCKLPSVPRILGGSCIGLIGL